MEQSAPFSREEVLGLLLAGTAHVALALVLIQHGPTPPRPEEQPRITVSLAEEVAMESTSPDPATDPAAARAPELAPVPAPPVAVPPPPPVRPTARPTPTPTASRRPSPTPTASRRPTPTPTASRRPSPTPTASRRPSPTPTATRSARPSPTPSATRGGGTVESAFSELGASAAGSGTDTRVPANQIGQSERASLVQSISRQVGAHWDAPNGLEAERLVTTVTWRLRPDGSLDGQPQCNPTQGITPANRTQAGRHCELAIRAIRLAAPFDLPPRFYEAWRLVRNFRFDGSLR